MIVNCYSDVDINLEDDEKETIKKAYEILKEVRHELFMQADEFGRLLDG